MFCPLAGCDGIKNRIERGEGKVKDNWRHIVMLVVGVPLLFLHTQWGPPAFVAYALTLLFFRNPFKRRIPSSRIELVLESYADNNRFALVQLSWRSSRQSSKYEKLTGFRAFYSDSWD